MTYTYGQTLRRAPSPEQYARMHAEARSAAARLLVIERESVARRERLVMDRERTEMAAEVASGEAKRKALADAEAEREASRRRAAANSVTVDAILAAAELVSFAAVEQYGDTLAIIGRRQHEAGAAA